MWIELILLIALFAALQWAFGTDQQGQEVLGWASLAISVIFAFEASDLRASALERRGYRLAGVATGRDRTEAELSFFSTWLPEQAKAARTAERGPQARRSGQAQAPMAGGEGEEVIGLFPRP
jgi:hypothetical protein